MQPLDIVLGLLSGGVGAAAIHYLRARRQAASAERIAATEAEAQVEIAAVIHDERIAPPLINRVQLLEQRLDQRDEEVRELRQRTDECERERERDRAQAESDREACKAEVAAMQGQLAQLQRSLDERDEELAQKVTTAVRQMRSTPPGAWRAEAPPEG